MITKLTNELPSQSDTDRVMARPPIDTVEQCRANLAFDTSESMGQCGLSDVQLRGGVGDVLSLGEHDEPVKFVEIHPPDDIDNALSCDSCSVLCIIYGAGS